MVAGEVVRAAALHQATCAISSEVNWAVPQVRRVNKATPWRSVKFKRSMKAMLSRPDRPAAFRR